MPILLCTPAGIDVGIGPVPNNLWKVNFIHHNIGEIFYYHSTIVPSKIVFTNTKLNNKLNIIFFYQFIYYYIHINLSVFFTCLKIYRLFILNNNNYNKSPPRAIATASWLYNNNNI